MAHEVFISHSSQDKPVADAVCAALESGGIRCWIAPRDVQPGRSFAGEITRAIQRSRVLVLIFSAHSNASEQVLREVQLAANSHLHIVQFRIEDVGPSEDLEYYLSTPHWLDALTPPLERNVHRLTTSVKALLDIGKQEAAANAGAGGTASPTPPPAVPPQVTPAAAIPSVASDAPAVPPRLPADGVTHSSSPPKPFPVALTILAASAVVLVLIVIGLLFSKSHIPRARSTSSTPPPTSATAAPQPSAVASASAAVANSSYSGSDPSFVFVDMNKAFKQFSKTKEAEQTINAAKEVAKKEYDERADDYKHRLDEINALNAQITDATGSAAKRLASERDDKIAAIKTVEREINDFRQKREKELQDQALKLRQAIVKDMTAHIHALAGSGISLVLDVSGSSWNGVPLLIVAPAAGNVTNDLSADLAGNSARQFTGERDLKIATIDMNRVFKYDGKTKDAETKINEAKAAAKSEYDDRADAYKAKLAEINKMNAQLEERGVSDDRKSQIARERDQKISDIKQMEREINDFRKSREKQLQDDATRKRADIVSDITAELNTQLATEPRALVFDRSGAGLTGVPVVLYSEVPDVSDAVTARVNRTTSSGAAPNPVTSKRIRVGVCDLDRAFKAHPDTKSAEDEVAAEREKAKAELNSTTESTRTAKEKELKDLALKKREPIVQKLTESVSRLARQHSLNLVFDSTAQSLNGVPLVIEWHGLPDLTDEVIADARSTR